MLQYICVTCSCNDTNRKVINLFGFFFQSSLRDGLDSRRASHYLDACVIPLVRDLSVQYNVRLSNVLRLDSVPAYQVVTKVDSS